MLELDGETCPISLRTTWTGQSEDGRDVGCRFESHDAFAAISERARAAQEASPATRRSLRLAPIWQIGLIAIMSLSVLGMLDTLRRFAALWSQ